MRKDLLPAVKLHFDNASLALERYAELDSADNEKRKLRAVMERLAAVEHSTVYSLRYARWREAMTTLPDVLVMDFELVTPMAVGMGNETVFENGLSFQRVYGMPVVPGSSLKGVLRRACAELLNLEIDDEWWDPAADVSAWTKRFGDPLPENVDVWRRLFGSPDAVGNLTVFDAWLNPIDGCKPFMVDVLTPHHADYYQGNQRLPLDSDQPNPVMFLAVRPKNVFTFAIQMPNEAWEDHIKQLLVYALGTLGVGAKTNAGYGLFRRRPWEPPKSKESGKSETPMPAVPTLVDGTRDVVVQLAGKVKPDRTAQASWEGRQFAVKGFLSGFSGGQGVSVVAKVTVRDGKLIDAKFVRPA